jgi:hypothetical protein
MSVSKHTANVLTALRCAMWYAARDDDADGERDDRREMVIAGMRSFWLGLPPDQQAWVLGVLEADEPEEAEGIRQAVLRGDVGKFADMDD